MANANDLTTLTGWNTSLANKELSHRASAVEPFAHRWWEEPDSVTCVYVKAVVFRWSVIWFEVADAWSGIPVLKTTLAAEWNSGSVRPEPSAFGGRIFATDPAPFCPRSFPQLIWDYSNVDFQVAVNSALYVCRWNQKQPGTNPAALSLGFTVRSSIEVVVELPAVVDDPTYCDNSQWLAQCLCCGKHGARTTTPSANYFAALGLLLLHVGQQLPNRRIVLRLPISYYCTTNAQTPIIAQQTHIARCFYWIAQKHQLFIARSPSRSNHSSITVRQSLM